MRLLEGSTGLEGRVEICQDNIWGTVCNFFFNKPDATVVCRQLGGSVVGMLIVIV